MANYENQPRYGGTVARGAEAIDAGLRAHMIRVYNYMTGALGITGVVAWLSYQAAGGSDIAIGGGAVTGVTAFGAAIFSGPAILVLLFGTLGAGVLPQLPHQPPERRRGAGDVLGLCRAARRIARPRSSWSTPAPASPRCSSSPPATFGAMSLWGYTTKRDLTGMGSFLFMGLIGIIIAIGGQHLPGVVGAAVRHLGDRRADLHGPHRLRHAEDQGNVLRQRRRHGRRPQGDHGRAEPLPRLHQPVPDAAPPVRRTATSRLARPQAETSEGRGQRPRPFLSGATDERN